MAQPFDRRINGDLIANGDKNKQNCYTACGGARPTVHSIHEMICLWAACNH